MSVAIGGFVTTFPLTLAIEQQLFLFLTYMPIAPPLAASTHFFSKQADL